MSAADLVPLLLAADAGGEIGFRQGTVVAWDSTSGANTINVGGTDLTNLPVLAASAITLAPGDVVGVLRTRSSWMILGAITTNSLRIRTATYSGATESITADSTWRNAPTPGPSLTTYIGNSRQCIVFTAMAYNAKGSLPGCGVAVSGASTIAPSDVSATAAGVTGSTAFTLLGAASGFQVLTAADGLNAGSNTFTMKYKASQDTGGSHLFWNRRLVVIPF